MGGLRGGPVRSFDDRPQLHLPLQLQSVHGNDCRCKSITHMLRETLGSTTSLASQSLATTTMPSSPPAKAVAPTGLLWH